MQISNKITKLLISLPLEKLLYSISDLPGTHYHSYEGNEADFSEYKAYFPGDEIKRIDWKVYIKSQKFYTKDLVVKELVMFLFLWILLHLWHLCKNKIN